MSMRWQHGLLDGDDEVGEKDWKQRLIDVLLGMPLTDSSGRRSASCKRLVS